MKKLTIIAVMLIVSAAAFGQSKFKFGVTGGMNLSKMDFKVITSDSKIGWNAGFIGELSIANNFYGNLSLLYSNKGYKLEEKDEGDKFITKQQANYIEVPLHIGYKLPVAENISILGEAGPYAGFLVNAKWKEEDIYDGEKHKDSASNKDEFKKIDVGLGIKAGIEFSQRIRLTVGYDWGLANLSKDGFKTHNRNFNVGMVLFF